MGAKWDTLSKAQQTALAQTVAGIRQYNQLMSLMNNWDYMQENVSLAQNSSGELNKQQQIYEESWEAASKRVKAAMEDMWDSLLKDDFFIELTDGFAKLINFVGDFIDSLGGLSGTLLAIGALVTKVFEKQMLLEILTQTNKIQ